MGEVLSQNEIDELLHALDKGELDVNDYKADGNEQKVKDYDFARPSKFSKEHLRTLEIIFEHYARLISTTLPAYLRIPTQVEVVNSEAISYSEFCNALSNPILLGLVDFQPLNGSIIVDLSANLGYAIIDRILGGTGETLEKKREFSEIELSLIEKVMVVCIHQMIEPWINVIEISPTLDRIETNSQFAQIIAPNEIIALITLNLKIGKVEGLYNICIPYICVEPIMDKLNTKYWYSTMKESNKQIYKDYIEKQITSSKIPIKAILGNSFISVRDFIHLQQGDIIKLDNKVDDPIEILVGNLRKFTAQPGIHNRNRAVKIDSIIGKEE